MEKIKELEKLLTVYLQDKQSQLTVKEMMQCAFVLELIRIDLKNND